MDDEIMGHTNTVRLHRMTLTVVIVADCWLVEIRDTAFLTVGAGRGKRCTAVYGGGVHGPELFGLGVIVMMKIGKSNESSRMTRENFVKSPFIKSNLQE